MLGFNIERGFGVLGFWGNVIDYLTEIREWNMQITLPASLKAPIMEKAGSSMTKELKKVVWMK